MMFSLSLVKLLHLLGFSLIGGMALGGKISIHYWAKDAFVPNLKQYYEKEEVR